MRSLSPLASVLCAVLLVTPAFSAFQEKPKETPRALYERAAYAEEHERDFQKAADLYGAASDAAKQSGDTKTAVEASAARDRALTRAGQVPKLQTPVDCSDPVLRRIADLLDSVSRQPQNTPDYVNAARDLSLFGVAAVPWVERVVTETIPLCNYTIVARSDRFIGVLTAMSTPEADAALDRLMNSPDPVTRRDVANRSNPARHTSILRRALADPVLDVRNAAINRVADSPDPAWLPEMLDAAHSGSQNALEFISHVKPEALVDIAADPKQDYFSRVKALDGLSGSVLITGARELPANPEISRRLLRLASAADEDLRLRRSTIYMLTRLVDNEWRKAPATIRQEIETTVAANIDAYPVPEVWDLLLALGGARSLDALTGSIGSKIDGLESNQFEQLLGKLNIRFVNLTPKDFDAAAAAFARVPIASPIRDGEPTRTQRLYDMYSRFLVGLARPEVPDASMVTALGRLDAEHRAAFMDVFASWISARAQSAAGLASRAALDPALIPALRQLAAGNNIQRERAAKGYGLVGDVRLWPELLRMRSASNANSVDQATNESTNFLISKDPAQAALVLDQALRESIQKQGGLDAKLVIGLAFLDSQRALDIFRKLWPLAKDEPAKLALLSVLTNDINGPEATAVVFEHYQQLPASSASDLRRSAIARFGNELYQPAIQVLGQALEDPEESVRENARVAFGRFKAQREAMEEFKVWMSTDQVARDSVAQLVTLLDNANRDVVLGAVRSLAALKAKSALPALVKLLEKNDPEVKKAVQDAITKIGE
jgi:HEAT repeat protein